VRERLLWIAVVKVVEEIDSVAIEPVSGSVVEVTLGLMGEFFGEAPIASVSLVGEVFGRAPIALVSPWYVFRLLLLSVEGGEVSVVGLVVVEVGEGVEAEMIDTTKSIRDVGAVALVEIVRVGVGVDG